jgi:hypothetical protein
LPGFHVPKSRRGHRRRPSIHSGSMCLAMNEPTGICCLRTSEPVVPGASSRLHGGTILTGLPGPKCSLGNRVTTQSNSIDVPW